MEIQLNKLIKLTVLFLLFLSLGSTQVFAQSDEGDDGYDDFWDDWDAGEELDEVIVIGGGGGDDDNDTSDDGWDDWDDSWDDSWDDDDDDNSGGGVDETNSSFINPDFNQGVQIRIPALQDEIQIRVKTEPLKIIIAPIVMQLPQIPLVDIAHLLEAYNNKNKTSLTVATVQQQVIASNNNQAQLSTDMQLFVSYLEALIIERFRHLVHNDDNYTTAEFENCNENGCHCTTDTVCSVIWYIDNDFDGYHSYSETADEGDSRPQDGNNWVQSTIGDDCDDNDATKTDNCDEECLKVCNVNEKLDDEKCECIPTNCEYKTGYLHESAFTSKTAAEGENTTTSQDNFRDEDGIIIADANCESGKIDSGSTVNVTGPKETRDYVKTDGTTSQANYFPVEYLDCPKGNKPGNPNYDSAKPCSDCTRGNPTTGNMQVAKQRNSGIGGGLYGDDHRKKLKKGSDGKYLKNTDGTYKLFPKWHRGIDIETDYGDPIYAMFDGTATLAGSNSQDAGYFVVLTSSINGKTVTSMYFHMQNANRKTGSIKAGDIIGYQGDSGNLKKAIKSKSAVSHVHIKIKENGVTVNPENYLKASINETTGVITSNCN
ncbi:M23 family metallopeptidase [Flavivirga aquimarina]|uniref:M23 family metallopeptidase n=1 Tax=Flavivirga aquimarina TaxID=2027862 RepID=A0ABT8W5I2_9FLAO|nr:M23 family metallopeptidase [Flavivirga aquimarina]MDO5968371.1 M23 family metallopeptidase [Flavivirga aquimarina]